MAFIKIQPSPVHGWGVFAACEIPKGTTLGYYAGVPFCKLEDVCDRDYVMEIFYPRHLYIDASDQAFSKYARRHGKDVWTKYMNCGNCKADQNAKFNRAGRIMTTRKIRAGEEIFMDYGVSYWQ